MFLIFPLAPLNLNSDKSVSLSTSVVKDQQEQLSTEERGFKPDLLVGVPTSNISDSRRASYRHHFVWKRF